ncbi:MAG: hypothetical protein IKK73_02405 [Akkermansia sp.]|nr:hypothetical protein [Akkermansia sp.]
MVKKIHYCWFGGDMPDSVKRNVEHWAKLNPDFEICEWNESNVDINKFEFGRKAAKCGKWGFLADIVRLEKLIEQGGVYLDADVELIRPFTPFIEEEKLIMGYMYDCALGTAVLYSPPGHPYLKDILHSYHHIKPDACPVNNTIFTAFFINQVQNFLLNGREWENELCHIYPKETFEQPAFIRTHGMSIHHCCGSWRKAFNSQFSFFPNSNILKHAFKWASRKWRTWQALQDNEFTTCYKAALKNKPIRYDTSFCYTRENPYK